jgi:hypothetical protein
VQPRPQRQRRVVGLAARRRGGDDRDQPLVHQLKSVSRQRTALRRPRGQGPGPPDVRPCRTRR